VARSLPACLAVALTVVLVSVSARGDEPSPTAPPESGARVPRFGDRGSFAFGGDLGIGGEQGLDHGFDTRVDLELDPAFDVFVARRLSLGVGGSLSYSFARASPSSSLVAVSPRVGYAFPLGALFALWPRLSMDFEYATDSEGLRHRIVSSTLFVPIDALVLPHFAVGLGPALSEQLLHRTDAGAAPRTTTAQLLVELAGWL
jgi:hypothetical protein